MSEATIVVCGHGPGISDAVAHRFGREGLRVALVARNAARLNASVDRLGSSGIEARAFPCDLSDITAVRALARSIHDSFGPIGVVHWNAYAAGAGDLASASLDELRHVVDVSVSGLLAMTQEALGDLKAQKGSVLVTGGGLAFYDPKVDAMAVQWKAMGLAIGKAAQHKTVGLLHEQLGAEGIFVGEVIVLGAVKGTSFDAGQATIEPSAVADRFWQLHSDRGEWSVQIR